MLYNLYNIFITCVFSLFLSLSSCKNTAKNGIINSGEFKQPSLSNNKFNIKSDTTIIKLTDYEYGVISNYFFSRVLDRPHYTSQLIYIKNNGHEIYSHKHLIDLDSMNIQSKKIFFLENFISRIGVISTEKEHFFISNGWTGTGYGSTISTIIDSNGEKVYELLQNEKKDTIYSKVGVLNQIFNQRITTEKYLGSKFDKEISICKNCIYTY